MRDSRYAGFKESAIGKKIAAGKVHYPALVGAFMAGTAVVRCCIVPPVQRQLRADTPFHT